MTTAPTSGPAPSARPGQRRVPPLPAPVIGAGQIMITYADREPAGVSFTLPGPGDTTPAFRLPVDVDAVYRLLRSSVAEDDIRRRLRKSPAPYQSREHAARVAWRTAKDWLEAQLALVQARMASLDQVMLPYLLVDGGTQTLYGAYQQTGRAALPGADR